MTKFEEMFAYIESATISLGNFLMTPFRDPEPTSTQCALCGGPILDKAGSERRDANGEVFNTWPVAEGRSCAKCDPLLTDVRATLDRLIEAHVGLLRAMYAVAEATNRKIAKTRIEEIRYQSSVLRGSQSYMRGVGMLGDESLREEREFMEQALAAIARETGAHPLKRPARS